MPRAHYELLARRSLLVKALPAHHVDDLLQKCALRRYDRGETLFLQGDTCNMIHIVLQGWVKLFRISVSGSEAVVGVFAPGESFGEAIALRNMPYPVSAEAVTKCEVLQLPSKVLVDLIHQDPEVALTILQSAFSHLHGLVTQLEQLKSRTGAQRVAEFLLALCKADSGECVVEMPYDKALIAGRLGLKPESLSRAFARLRPMSVKIDKNLARIGDVRRLRDYIEQQA